MAEAENKDIEKIKVTVRNYLDGVIKGEYKKIVEAWHKEGVRVINEPETGKIVYQNSPASTEYATYKPNPAIKQEGIIEKIEKTGTAASVKAKWILEGETWKGKCTDYLILLKEKEKWIITAKVSAKDF